MATPPTFTAGSVLTAAQMNFVGLWEITSVSLSGVTNNVTSCFSSDFTNYLVKISAINNSTTTTRSVTVKLLSGTTPTTDSTYTSNSLYQYGVTTSGSSVVASTSYDLTSLSSNTGGSGFVEIEFFNPNLASPTSMSYRSHTYQSNITAWIYRTGSGIHNTSTSYTGFQINGTTDNLSGTVTVYGFNKA